MCSINISSHFTKACIYFTNNDSDAALKPLANPTVLLFIVVGDLFK